MKIVNRMVALVLVCSVVGLVGCANTANGIHQDWKHGTQKIANATNN
jgi:predicted small secreted protein